MTSEPGAPNAKTLLRSAAIFRELSNDQLAEIWSRTKIHNLLRGELLIRQGEKSNSVHVVVRQVPAIYETLLRAIARRLAASISRISNEQRAVAARTVVVIPGGSRSIPRVFFDR